MDDLLPSAFFNLGTFTHKAVFLLREHVWATVANIPNYLKTKSLGVVECGVPRGTFLENPELISIGKGTVIEPGAFIKGPCIIGENCQIRHGAYLRGNVIMGNECIVGHTTEVKNSIMLDKAFAAHFAYVGDSILGRNVNVGAGVKFANLKLNKREVLVLIHGTKVATGMHKLGAIIGDDTQLGCNVVTNPGTLIGQGVVCFPNLTVGGVIEARKTLKPNHHAVVS